MLFLWQIVSDPKTGLGWLNNWLARLLLLQGEVAFTVSTPRLTGVAVSPTGIWNTTNTMENKWWVKIRVFRRNVEKYMLNHFLIINVTIWCYFIAFSLSWIVMSLFLQVFLFPSLPTLPLSLSLSLSLSLLPTCLFYSLFLFLSLSFYFSLSLSLYLFLLSFYSILSLSLSFSSYLSIILCISLCFSHSSYNSHFLITFLFHLYRV